MDQVAEALISGIPPVLVLTVTATAWWLVHRFSIRDPERRDAFDVSRKLLQVAIVIMGIVGLVLAIPVDPQIKGALLGAVGVAIAAVIGLSSTTIVGNALAGLMLRTVQNYRVGDFLSIEGHFGRVTYRRLLATEIQTEDRDLTTLPNLFLVTHPVKVVRASGTVVSADVSIGYDVHRLRLEPHFHQAVEDAGLTDPFVRVQELGDHSVTYKVAGFLTEVKNLLSVRSALRAAIFDRLNDARIEIVSPTFMNQRPLDPGMAVLASRPVASSQRDAAGEPEDIIFDKAEAASALEELRTELEAAKGRLEGLEEERRDAPEAQWSRLDRSIAILDAEVTALTNEIEARTRQAE